MPRCLLTAVLSDSGKVLRQRLVADSAQQEAWGERSPICSGKGGQNLDVCVNFR
jgi:hypothetical protein